MIRRAALLTVLISLASLVSAFAVELGPISLGIHVTPSVERTEERRTWDAVFSLSAVADLTEHSSLEMLIITDSGLTGLGTGVSYRHALTEPFSVGAGLSILWQFEEKLLHPIIGTFALAGVEDAMQSGLSGRAELSFPLLTLARQFGGWEVLPLAELPTVILHGNLDLGNRGGVEARVTLQPVIVETTILTNPLGVISDDLLIVPTLSGFIRYLSAGSP